MSRKKTKIPFHNPKYLQWTSTLQQSKNTNWRIAKQKITKRPYSKQGKNPLDKYGNPMKCAICYNINRWEQNCPDSETENIHYE